MYTVYSKPGCTLCEKSKQILKDYQVPFTEIVIGRDISREDILKKFPWAKVAPIIVNSNDVPVDTSKLEHILEGKL